MSTIIKILQSLLIPVVISSCVSAEPERHSLETAEQLMENHPDSALMILQSITADRLNSKEHALYGLLMSQALDKNYIDVTSDSLIKPAIDYFSASDDKFQQMKSLYYLGTTEYYRKAYTGSLISSFRAYELACELDQKFWIGLTARRIAEIYKDNYCAKEQKEFARIALDNFRQTDRKRFIHYGIYDLASAIHSSEDYTTARRMCYELIDTANVYDDNVLKRQALELIGLGFIATDSLTIARDIFREILSLPTVRASDSAFYNGISLRLHINDDLIGDVTKIVDSKELSSDLSHWLQYQWYMAHDSTAQALQMSQVLNVDINRALKESRRHDLAGSLLEYYRYKEEIDKLKLSNAHLLNLMTVIGALIVICVIIIYVRHRNLRHKLQIEEYLTMSNELRSLLEETSHELDMLRTESEDIDSLSKDERTINVGQSISLLENYFSELDALCRTFRRDTTAAERQKISDSVGRMIYSFADGDKIKELEDYVNLRYEGIMTKLRSDFPKLKDIDYTIFMLSRLGFSIPTVALLLKKEDDKMFIYNHRKRLRNRFRDFVGPNRDLYIEVLP